MITELSFIRDTDTFSNEIELLKQIEDFKWGMMPGDYVRSRRPRYAFVYDPSIINHGIPTPPHIELGDEIIQMFSLLTEYL